MGKIAGLVQEKRRDLKSKKCEILIELSLLQSNKNVSSFSAIIMTNENLQLVYTLLCDDVRIEMGNKISLMGVFQNIMVEKLPISLIKFAVVNHWRGAGNHNTEVRILSPNKGNLRRYFTADAHRTRARRIYR